jgi:glutathione S-transferase
MLEKGLRWTTRIVDLTRMEQKRPEYLALNPNGLVPTLEHDGRILYESNVITEYLDDVFPEPPLYPRDPWARAQAKMWQAFELAMANAYTIADVSVAPRVAMYPLVGLALVPDRHQRVCGWLGRLAARPSFGASESVQPPAE